jgi:hypothetical protein
MLDAVLDNGRWNRRFLLGMDEDFHPSEQDKQLLLLIYWYGHLLVLSHSSYSVPLPKVCGRWTSPLSSLSPFPCQGLFPGFGPKGQVTG